MTPVYLAVQACKFQVPFCKPKREGKMVCRNNWVGWEQRVWGFIRDEIKNRTELKTDLAQEPWVIVLISSEGSVCRKDAVMHSPKDKHRVDWGWVDRLLARAFWSENSGCERGRGEWMAAVKAALWIVTFKGKNSWFFFNVYFNFFLFILLS